MVVGSNPTGPIQKRGFLQQSDSQLVSGLFSAFENDPDLAQLVKAWQELEAGSFIVKQRSFIREDSEAARRAGYSIKCAHQQAYELAGYSLDFSEKTNNFSLISD